MKMKEIEQIDEYLNLAREQQQQQQRQKLWDMWVTVIPIVVGAL